MKRAKELFHSYAETFLSEDDLEVKAISLETLSEMNLQHKIFSSEQVYKLTGAKTNEETEKILEKSHGELEARLSEIQWRLSESNDYGQYQEEFSTLLDILSVKLYSSNNPKSVWLCFRLLEEESKRMIVHDKVSEMLPKIAVDFLDL